MSDAEIVILGSGTAFHTDGRASQCLLLRRQTGSASLVDLGPTAVYAMERFGVDYDAIDRLFITHLHGDHIAGWPFLVLNLSFQVQRRRPLDVFGPAGTGAALERLLDTCYGEILEDAGLGFEIRYHELEVRSHEPFDAGGGFRCAVEAMDHHPSSIGFRLEWAGHRVAVTGDTRWCDGLERLAAGCDLLAVECTTVDETPHAHLWLGQLRARRAQLRVPRILLIHLTDEVAAELAADPMPGVTAAHDGMEFPLGLAGDR